MSYSKPFEYICKVLSKMLYIMGVNILDKTYRPNWRTVYLILLTICGTVGLTYTLYYHRSTFVMFLRSLSIAPEAVQGWVKIYLVLRYDRSIASLVNFIRKVYQLNSNPGSERAKALITCVNYVSTSFRVAAVILILLLIIISTPPLYAYFIEGQNELFFEWFFPGYPAKTDRDYKIYLCLQFVLLILTYMGNISMDALVLLVVVHFSLLTGLFMAALKELDELVNNSDNINIDGQNYVRFVVRNCVLMHQDLIGYISMINSIFSRLFLWQVATAAMSLAVNCFCIVKTDWVGAYAIAIFAFIKIFMLCTLGTFVDILSDKVVDAIYDLSWYKYPLDCQRTIYLILLRSQNFNRLTMANVATLNVATGAQIMKAIYSYLMMLLSFDE